jgi:hypothetical protein
MSVKNVGVDTDLTTSLPRDEYSVALRKCSNNPAAVTKQSIVELIDTYGNSVTWVIKTVRADGSDTVFLQKNDATGGDRIVLPPDVTSVLARHRDGAATVNRKRGANKAAATRKAKGIEPAFLKKAGER